jgi:hypothetical protein
MKKIWEIYFKLLIITLLIGFTINLTSCLTRQKTFRPKNKPCTCIEYGQINKTSYTMSIPYTDTIIMSSLHYHLEDEYICSWVPADTNIYNDTLYLEVYNEVK